MRLSPLFALWFSALLAAAAAQPAPSPTPATGAPPAGSERSVDKAMVPGPLSGDPAGKREGQPLLRIETGTHSAFMLDASADAAGTRMLTVSADKTARLWSLPELRPLGVLRPHSDPDPRAGLYSAALSPDGKLAAVGGVPFEVLVFDTATHSLLTRWGDLPGPVRSLAFSADGTRLAAGFSKGGLRVWQVAEPRTPPQEDTDYAAGVFGLSFAPDGRLAAASLDGALRLYDQTLQRTQRVDTAVGKRPYRVRFSPDGKLLAVGFNDALGLEVRDGGTLALKTKPNVVGLTGSSLGVVGWSRDGTSLLAGGASRNKDKVTPVYQWANAGTGAQKPMAVRAGDAEPLVAILPLAGGQVAFGTQQGSIAVAAPTGRLTAERAVNRPALDVASGLDHPSRRFRLSEDGTSVEWTPFLVASKATRWLTFNVTQLSLLENPQPSLDMKDWSAEAEDVKVTDWDGGEHPNLNGRPVDLGPANRAESVSAAKNRIVLGTHGMLMMVDAGGEKLWTTRLDRTVWRVNQSADGRVVVAALEDGTIRWFRATDGREMLSLLVTADGRGWVTYMPSGFYAASPGGEDLIGWHIDHGAEQAADFFGASRFRDRFYQPKVVTQILASLDELEASAHAVSHEGETAHADAAVTRDLPPVVTILSPADGTSLPGEEVTIEYAVRSPSGKPLKGVRVLVAGRPAEMTRGFGQGVGVAAAGETRGNVSVIVPAGRIVDVTLLADTETRTSEPARVQVAGAPPKTKVAALLPRLNALFVGVSEYRDPTLRLAYAANDARELAAVLKGQVNRGLYREVNIKILVDAEATRTAVLGALDALRRDTTSNDVAVAFFAGHGVLESGRTFFLPVDGDPENLYVTAVAQTDMQGILSRVPGRVVAFVDICHAGAAVLSQGNRDVPDMTIFVNQLREPGSGLIVFAGAAAREVAVELPLISHGAFTAALIEGLKGDADSQKRGAVSTAELNVFVADRVRVLTKGRQHPVMQRPGDVPDFPIAASLR